MASSAGVNLNQALSVFKTSKRLLVFLWKTDKLLFLQSIFSALAPSVIPFINAYIYKLIIDMIAANIAGVSFNFGRFYILIGLRFLTFIIQNLLTSFQDYIDLMLWTKLPVELYRIVLLNLSRLDLQYFEDSRFKDMLQRVRESYMWRPLNMLSAIFYTFQSLATLIIAIVIISTLNIYLGFVIVLIALPVFLNQTNYSKRIWGIWEENSPFRKKFWYISDLVQSGQSAKEMKIFQTAKIFINEIDKIQKRFVSENLVLAKRRLRVTSLLDALESAVFIGIEFYIIVQTVAKKITLGSLTYYSFVVGNFQAAVGSLFRNLAQVYNQSLYVEDIFKVMDAKPLILPPKSPVKINITKAPRIEFKNVDFTYPGSNRKILKNFSLNLMPGEKIAFVGANGAGKTTVIKLLARFYDVDDGKILIDGVDLKNIDLNSWYKSLGVIFQDFIKYEYTLRENIYFGKTFEKENPSDIVSAAVKSGADKVAHSFAKGYDQVLGKTFEGGEDISVGEWQKVALARAFLRDAPVLILDEPTASIDAKSENEIFDKVEKLGKDRSVIIISHRFSTVRNADKIYVISKGKIIESGSHDTLMAKGGMYHKLFGLQAKRYI